MKVIVLYRAYAIELYTYIVEKFGSILTDMTCPKRFTRIFVLI